MRLAETELRSSQGRGGKMGWLVVLEFGRIELVRARGEERRFFPSPRPSPQGEGVLVLPLDCF
jgi:hypothetical protein